MPAKPRSKTLKPAESAGRVKIVTSDPEMAPNYYANHVEVGQSIHEYEIVFAKLPTLMRDEQIEEVRANRTLSAETLVRVFIPATLMTDFINVLRDQQGKHDDNVKRAAEAAEATTH